jgi:hypothetical protein
MKSWYKYFKKICIIKTASASIAKSASITFSLEDAWKISQPKNLLDLCSDFLNFIHYGAKLSNDRFRPGYSDIEPDTSSSDFEGYTGVINFYVKQDDDINEYPKAIKAWIDDKSIEGYQITCSMNPEKSNSRNSQVFRIMIIQNPSEHYESIPDLNLANGNAMSILRLLGLSVGMDDDYSGKIDLNDLRKRIEAVSKEEMQKEILPPGYLADHANMDMNRGQIDTDEGEGWKGPSVQENPPSSGVPIFQPGRDEEYIDNRLQGLYEIVDYGIKNGFKNLVWG